MTPCEKLGYKVGDRFEVINPDENSSRWSVGTIIILHKDDNSSSPAFRREGFEWANNFAYLTGVKKINGNLRTGDEITQDGKKYRVTLEEIPQYEFDPGMICRVVWDGSETCLNRSYCTRVVYIGNARLGREKISYADKYGDLLIGYVNTSNLRPE